MLRQQCVDVPPVGQTGCNLINVLAHRFHRLAVNSCKLISGRPTGGAVRPAADNMNQSEAAHHEGCSMIIR